MKIFIVADMEGATGVVHRDQLMPEGRGYQSAQRYLTGDVNAVIEGCLEALPKGSHVFRVADGHGIMRNIVLEELHEAAELVVGPAVPENRPLCQCEGIDESFDVAVFVGFHSKARTPFGLLSHTYVGSAIADVRVNGKSVGEAELNAVVLGSLGVPVGLVIGNSDLEHEVRSWSNRVGFVATKQTLGPSAAICLPPKKTRELIRQASAQMITEHAHTPFPAYQQNETHLLEVEMYRAETALRASRAGGVELASDRVLKIGGLRADEAFRTMWNALSTSLYDAPAWLQ